MADERVAQVAALFDAVAPTYDQVGVEFFGPIARRLVELLDVRPGEDVVELGCGRGALTLPLAEAVGPSGSVRAGDVSPAMVAAACTTTSGFPHVDIDLVDAAAPTYDPRSADCVAASLVLFFLPDPPDALRRWITLLRPGGRIGLTTFGPQDEVWLALDALFDPYLPPHVLDARTSGRAGPFASDAAFERLVRACGAHEVSTHTQSLEVPFVDAPSWKRWTMSVGQRMMWSFVPEDRHGHLLERAAELIGAGCDLRQDVRHTVGRVR